MKEQIIKNLELETGKTLDSNFQSQVLCDGETCRHEECQCWNELEKEVREVLTNE